ncbi:hypothetical protein LEP1GSC040_1636 [Leptospira santarosai str. 2000030832]|nr:hypothetical protein LEP1GSC040_1636 [Leptospira santarosai str. 2000030832]
MYGFELSHPLLTLFSGSPEKFDICQVVKAGIRSSFIFHSVVIKRKSSPFQSKKRIFKFNEIVYNFLTYFLLKRNKNKIESGDTISWAKRAPNTTIPS